MKIREGAYYRTRDGDVAGPMRRTKDQSWYSNYHTWNKDGGIFLSGAEHGLDLISEVYVSDTPPDSPSDDLIVRMNFSELARKGCKTNSGNVHFFCGMDYVHAHYSVILHGGEGASPSVPPAPPADVPAPEAKTLRDEAANAALTGLLAKAVDDGSMGVEDWASDAYLFADAMMEARKK